MIVDKLANWQFYSLGPAWRRAIDFVQSLDANAEQRRYDLQGNDIYALVVGYQTRSVTTAQFEAHRKYVDLQVVLSGVEALEWAHLDGLEVATPFDSAEDATLYHRPNSGVTHIDFRAGMFTALFPHDAHIPGLSLDENPTSVVKVVVKISVELLPISAG